MRTHCSRAHRRHAIEFRQSGLNLLEIMICTVIITIMLQFSLPASQWLLRDESERVISQAAEMIQLARSHAIRSDLAVTLCPARFEGCGADWNLGIVLVSDGEQVHRQDWTAVHGTVHWRSFGASNRLEFDTTGALLHQNGSLMWCPLQPDAGSPHQLVINGAGRIRLAEDSDGDGWREDGAGNPLDCDDV